MRIQPCRIPDSVVSQAAGTARQGAQTSVFDKSRYTVKIESLSVPVLSAKWPAEICIEHRMLRNTFDMRVFPSRQ